MISVATFFERVVKVLYIFTRHHLFGVAHFFFAFTFGLMGVLRDIQLLCEMVEGLEQQIATEREKQEAAAAQLADAQKQILMDTECIERIRKAGETAEAKLQSAEQKLAKLDRLIQLAQQTDAGKSDAEIAASSEFSEAIAYGQCQLLEDELAATQAKLQIAREALEKIALPKEYEGIRGWDATEEAATAHAALAQITKP